MQIINKLKIVINLLGSLLLVLACVLLIPIVVSVIYQEQLESVFLISALLSCVIGLIGKLTTKKQRVSLTTGMIVCALGWIIVSLLGALPFYLALDYSFIDTFFESVSGFTTTGITVFTGLENLPRSILFWRSLIQWLGGLGILTFFLFVTFKGQGGLFKLFTAESHKINQSRPTPNILKTIRILWLIYGGFTIVEILILYLLGVSFFDALAHSLTTVSTGGFSPYDSSIGYFKEAGYQNYKAIEYVIIFFMTLGGINFLVHYKVLTGDLRELWDGIEMKYFWGIIVGAVSLILINHYSYFPFDWTTLEEAIRKTLFQVIALLTTTGFGTQDIGSSFFPAVARQIFLILMLTGACVGSTSGGFKLIRIVILNKLFKREIKKIYYPKGAVLPVVVDDSIIADKEVFRVVALFFGWLLLLFIGGGITAFFSDLPAWNAFSGIFSALGNIGPFYFSVEQMQELSDIIKVTYIIAMLAGRLEILPLFILFNQQAWRR
ncbi:TrkH family potassium uptake protein [Natroniella sulfidigena]|uniref:TrkH family potassium uptake protein n=1 Tax=Natroniella sulfidigena TaxID=723921 RepID=UPI00200A6FDC|nr:TrkH family potassium uptake protein [Natroniella sulfidigena]